MSTDLKDEMCSSTTSITKRSAKTMADAMPQTHTIG